jgi:hypothetical protein
MAKNNNQKKPTTTKSKKSSGIKSNTFIRWKLIIVLVLLVSLIGGYFVYVSNAATKRIFTRTPTQMSGGSLKYDKSVRKTSSYKISGESAKLRTILTATEARNSRAICAYYRAGGYGALYLRVGTSSQIIRKDLTKKSQTNRICINRTNGFMHGDNIIVVYVDAVDLPKAVKESNVRAEISSIVGYNSKVLGL